MKIIFVGVVSFFLTVVYFIVLNFLPLSWFFVPLIMIILIYLNYGIKYAMVAALIAGLVTDLHFLYVGPFMGVFMLVIFFMWLVDTIFDQRRTFVSVVFVSLCASTVFVLTSELPTIIAHTLHGTFTISQALKELQLIMVFCLVTSMVNQVIVVARKTVHA